MTDLLSGSIMTSPHSFPFKSGNALNQGFTLVEIALSLGIMAFAFLGVIGLLPVGLGASKQAIDATLVSQISQEMTAQALQTDFSGLASLSAEFPAQYDEQGNRLEAGSTELHPEAIYAAAFEVPTDAEGKPVTTLSANTPNQVSTSKLATVKAYILNAKGRRSSTETDPRLAPDAEVFVVLVPDNGR